MESDQVEKRVKWLEDQRRRETDLLQNLREQADSLEGELGSIKDQLKETAGDVARLTALAGRVREFDESLHRHREEVGRQLSDLEDRRQKREEQLAETRRSEVDEINKAIAEIRRELSGIEELGGRIDTRQEEEQRITRALDEIRKRVEDLEDSDKDLLRQIVASEKARSKEGNRIADLQSETANLRNQLESISGTGEVLTDRIRTVDTRLQELAVAEASRTESMQAWIENQARKLIDFERSWKEWLGKFNEFEKRADLLDQRMQKYEQTFRGVKQVEKNLQGVIDRMERRINEITEMQRLSEDRIRQDWTNFQADDQKRWNTYKLASEERWREHNRLHEGLAVSVEAGEQKIDDLLVLLSKLEQSEVQRVRELMAVVRSWVDQIDSEERSG